MTWLKEKYDTSATNIWVTGNIGVHSHMYYIYVIAGFVSTTELWKGFGSASIYSDSL